MGGWFSDVLSGPQQNRDGVMNEWCLEHGCLAAVVSHVPPGPFVVFFQSPFLDSRQQSRRKPLYIALRSGGLKQEICVYCLHTKAQPLFKPMIFVASPDAFDPSGPMMLAAGM